MDISKCETCTEDCPQAKGRHEAAVGRMYAMRELAKCAPYWDALFDEDDKPKITPDRLRELVEADRDGQCVILPDVDDKAKKSVAEGLRDFFQEWAYEDRAVGLCGMTEEEKKVAEALLLALNGGRPC